MRQSGNDAIILSHSNVSLHDAKKNLAEHNIVDSALSFLILVFQKRTFAFSKTMTIRFCYLLFIATNYYFNIYFTIPRLLYKTLWGFCLVVPAGRIVVASFCYVPSNAQSYKRRNNRGLETGSLSAFY